MSHDLIPEIKTATVMFKVANTPECYHVENENIKRNLYCESHNIDAELTPRIDDVLTSTDVGNAR
jgi:predicted secreted Zn-dependent protease